MSSSPPSTEPKTTTNDEDTAESVYSVEEDDSDERESETDAFSRVKPSLLKTPSVLNAIINQIHPDILAKSHQSNYVLFPPQLEGCTVVDLGCGVGRDVFILSKLVGDKGRVIGIDSEKDQLNLARKFIDYHKNKFGLLETNVEFLHGEIDRLEQTKIAENSVDVVVSNSVINHRRDKRALIHGVCRILKPGGEFYFSDVYSNRVIPKEHQKILAGEYFGGALSWEDLILYATEAGFTQPRLVIAKPISVDNEEIRKAIGQVKFVSAIFRCFKLPSRQEDGEEGLISLSTPYQLTYERPLSNSEEEFFFDHLLQFKIGELSVVSDPTIALALTLSRYKDNFIFESIENDNAGSVTVVESIEEQPTRDNNQTYKKTTTITRITSDSPAQD